MSPAGHDQSGSRGKKDKCRPEAEPEFVAGCGLTEILFRKCGASPWFIFQISDGRCNWSTAAAIVSTKASNAATGAKLEGEG
jgi:hypothetical protein